MISFFKKVILKRKLRSLNLAVLLVTMLVLLIDARGLELAKQTKQIMSKTCFIISLLVNLLITSIHASIIRIKWHWNYLKTTNL